MSEKKMARRDVAIAIGIICVVVIASSVAGIAIYMSATANLQNQVTTLQSTMKVLLTATSMSVDEITRNASAWMNKKVVVEGYLSIYAGFGPSHPPYGYALSHGEPAIGVDWQGDNYSYNLTNVVVLGTFTSGRWMTITPNGTEPIGRLDYFIVAERIILL
jgi:hypothetical protein